MKYINTEELLELVVLEEKEAMVQSCWGSQTGCSRPFENYNPKNSQLYVLSVCTTAPPLHLTIPFTFQHL